MPTVFPGWYIQVKRVNFLSKHWEVIFYDGVDLLISLAGTSKSLAEDFAQNLMEEICKDKLERLKEEQPEIFNEILKNGDTMWDTGGGQNRIPLGEIAQKLYPEETKLACS